MDLAIRMCLLGLLATLTTVALLVASGLWILLALFPYLVAYLSYRGAVAGARSYGVAVATVLDLNRFRLHEQLHVKLPQDSDEEYEQGRALSRLLDGIDPQTGLKPPRVVYSHPPTPADEPPGKIESAGQSVDSPGSPGPVASGGASVEGSQ